MIPTLFHIHRQNRDNSIRMREDSVVVYFPIEQYTCDSSTVPESIDNDKLSRIKSAIESEWKKKGDSSNYPIINDYRPSSRSATRPSNIHDFRSSSYERRYCHDSHSSCLERTDMSMTAIHRNEFGRTALRADTRRIVILELIEIPINQIGHDCSFFLL